MNDQTTQLKFKEIMNYSFSENLNMDMLIILLLSCLFYNPPSSMPKVKRKKPKESRFPL